MKTFLQKIVMSRFFKMKGKGVFVLILCILIGFMLSGVFIYDGNRGNTLDTKNRNSNHENNFHGNKRDVTIDSNQGNKKHVKIPELELERGNNKLRHHGDGNQGNSNYGEHNQGIKKHIKVLEHDYDGIDIIPKRDRNQGNSHHGNGNHGKKEHEDRNQGNTKQKIIDLEIDRHKLDILQLVPFLHSKNLTKHHEKNVTYQQRQSRMLELMDSIQNTLNHPYVRNVFIFYQDPLLIPFMEKQHLNNSNRMTFVPNMEDAMSTLFRYANEHLVDHVVMIMNADVYPVEGFEKLDFEYLRTNKTMYSLSRHGRKEKNCDHTNDWYANQCNRTNYVNSMDTFIFSPKVAFSQDHYKLMHYSTRYGGLESVVCWVFRDLHYTVLNPCMVLKTYHYHCGVRLKKAERINREHAYKPLPSDDMGYEVK